MRKSGYLLQSRHGIFYFRFVPPARLRQESPDLPSEIRISLRTRDPREAVRQSHLLAYHYKSLAMGEKPFYPQLTHVFRDAQGQEHQLEYTPEEVPAAMQMIASLTMRGGMQHFDANGEPTETAEPAEPSRSRRSPRLSVLIQAYGEAEKLKSWAFEQEPALRDFREVVSAPKDGVRDAVASVLGEAQVRRYRTWLVQTPAGTRSLCAYWTDRQEPDGPPMSPKTANKKLSHVRGFLKWLHQQQYIKKDLAALLYDEKIREDDDTGGYEPFNHAELKAMFESEEFRQPSVPWRYWIPVLGLYTGARLDELSQLFTADVRQFVEDPTKPPLPFWSLHITRAISPEDQAKLSTGEKKDLKNKASERQVVLHPKVLELGFLDFVNAQRKAGHVRLFPELTYDGKNGYARKPSRWFQDFTKRQGVYVPRKKVFHSFRSTLNMALQSMANAGDELREKLLGHRPANVNRQSYGSTYNPAEALKVLEKVDYEVSIPAYRP